MTQEIDYNEFARSSFENCIIPAENGDQRAQARLSLLYLNGEGVPLDVAIGSQWLAKAAQDELAVNLCFKNGRDRKEAGAIFGLFLMWSNGYGVPRSKKIATKYLKQAAEMGYVQAECVMGIYYGNPYSEDGLRYSPRKAERWLLRAQRNGSKQANHHLYIHYTKGIKKPNFKKGIKHLELSVMDGDRSSLEYMGAAYENGIGVEKNLILAAKYYYLSGVQLDEGDSHSSLTRAAANLNDTELSSAVSSAEEWIMRHAKNAQFFSRKTKDPLKPS